MAMDDEVPGAVGTSASFALRFGQTIFSAASLLFMYLGVEFHNYTAFCFLVTIMGLVTPWSITLALIDIYSVLIRCPIRQPGILLFIVIGDWALSFLTLAAASSIAGIVDVLHRTDETFCPAGLCSRYQISAGSCGFDLHPCCAKLPMLLDDGHVKLYLYRKVSATCHRCGRKGRNRSWSYRSTCKKYNLHVACVKEMLVDSWHEIYFGHGDNYNNNYRKLENRIPSLKGTLQTHHKKSKGKAQKCCEVAGLALQFIISAVLGDPTTLIAGVVASLMSK